MLAILATLLLAAPALARERIEYRLANGAALSREGWVSRNEPGFRDGRMVLAAGTGGNWVLPWPDAAESAWWRRSGSSEGWVFEATLRIDGGDERDCDGETGFSV